MTPNLNRLVLLTATTLALTTTSAPAQPTFIPVPSTATPVPLLPAPGGSTPDDEGISPPILLPVPFLAPSGAVLGPVQITSNGRLFAAGALPAPSYDIVRAGMDSLPTGDVIAPLWADLIGAEIFIDSMTIPGTSIVTWKDAELYPSSERFSFQVHLSNVGEMKFVYDDRCDEARGSPAIVGYSAGAGSSVTTDMSAQSDSVHTTVAVLEIFGGGDRFDLGAPLGRRAGLTCTRLGGGSYSLSFAASAATRRGRRACQTQPPASGPVALEFTPVGPTYDVDYGGSFDAAAASAGTPLGLTNNSQVLVPVSFPVRFPGGPQAGIIRITDNGRVTLPITSLAIDSSPTIMEFRNYASPQVAPLWADLVPEDDDDVKLFDDGSRVVVTWDVPQGLTRFENRFQAQFFPDGRIVFAYAGVGYTPELGGIAAVIGISPGFGVPNIEGEVNLSSAPFSPMHPLVVERFRTDESPPDFAYTQPTPNHSAILFELAPPKIGSQFRVGVADLTGTATTVHYMFGVPTGIFTGSLNLGFLGLPECELLNDVVTPGALIAAETGSPMSEVLAVDIPAVPAFVGIDYLVVSGLVFNLWQSPSLFPLDELVVSIGN